MSKKHILIMIVAAAVSFSAAFSVTFLGSKRTSTAEDANSIKTAASSKEQDIFQIPLTGAGSSDERNQIIEKQLSSMIYDVRQKIQQYETKLKDLEQQEQRMKLTQQAVAKDIEQLDNLRIELSTKVTALKDEREKLLASRIKVAQSEKTNLAAVAAAYDKMDSASASKILVNMSKLSEQGKSDFGLDEAVRILFYMAERTKAKVLAEMVNTEPKLAAVISDRLKRIVEE